ncbi:MAG: hypothetical protein ABIS21_04925 [Acidimicrobiales bacterium]
MVGGLLAASPASVSAAPLSGQPFSAYGSGAAVITNALTLGTTTVANTEAAFSGGAVNSQGLNAPITNELGINVAPVTAGKNALGRGTGLELGLVTATPQPTTLNQLLLTALAVATAPPPSGLVTREIPLDVNPVAFASTLRGQAQATYDPAFCPVGRPLTFGLGAAENLQLLNGGGPTDPVTGFPAPLVGTSTPTGTPRAASQSRTVTYLAANGDGTFGVVSETRQTVAPITLLGTVPGTGLLIEVAGEFGIRATATGKPGGASVVSIGTPVLTVSTLAPLLAPVPIIGPVVLQQVVGAAGLNVDLSPLALVSAGAPPRALNGALGSLPALNSASGTSASGALDVVRLGVLGLPGLTGIDLRLGHMEAAVSVPAGGLTCDIPVSKVASVDPVQVGQDFTYTISIPSDPALFNALFNCDLVNISAVDRVETQSGSPRIQLISADRGGVVSGNTVTWASLGSYTLGQPPIILTITARIPASSGAGVLRDTVNVSATLGNCRGGATGEDLIQGNARLNGSAITGAVTLIAPNVSRGDLAATGGNSWPLVAGAGFLLAALGLVRLRRRASEVSTQG